jgi:hypothetical protein
MCHCPKSTSSCGTDIGGCARTSLSRATRSDPTALLPYLQTTYPMFSARRTFDAEMSFPGVAAGCTQSNSQFHCRECKEIFNIFYKGGTGWVGGWGGGGLKFPRERKNSGVHRERRLLFSPNILSVAFASSTNLPILSPIAMQKCKNNRLPTPADETPQALFQKHDVREGIFDTSKCDTC